MWGCMKSVSDRISRIYTEKQVNIGGVGFSSFPGAALFSALFHVASTYSSTQSPTQSSLTSDSASDEYLPVIGKSIQRKLFLLLLGRWFLIDILLSHPVRPHNMPAERSPGSIRSSVTGQMHAVEIHLAVRCFGGRLSGHEPCITVP